MRNLERSINVRDHQPSANRIDRSWRAILMRGVPLLLVATFLAWPGVSVQADSPSDRYRAALAREERVRESTPTLQELRQLITAYQEIVRRFPRSGYSDNALWQGAGLALEAYRGFGHDEDRRQGLAMLDLLRSEYPSSSLQRRLPARVRQLQLARTTTPSSARGTAPVLVRNVRRTRLADVIRVVIEMDAEVEYHEEQLSNPARLFFDLAGTTVAPELRNERLSFEDDAVRAIRLGQHPGNVTRVVLDLEGVSRYSVFSLYSPYRLVIDCVPDQPAVPSEGDVAPVPPPIPEPSPTPPPTQAEREAPENGAPLVTTRAERERPGSGEAPPVPAVPAANSNGEFSIARQLGLGISRIVIDPGHGGHDPGAKGTGLTEAELVLDVALRVERLLLRQPGFEVVMTRSTDVFVPLEERTALANRENADLFLSIHANASRNPKAGGIETYFLNFASNPEAEAVAARENSASGRAMHNLPDIVQAIALNNKLDESKDFAEMVQRALVDQVRPHHEPVRDLGVKKAPFVVLIGAKMPSVLAEISFVTNPTEGKLLRTATYRQRLAEALFNAITGYRRSLKNVPTTVAQQ